MAELINDIAGDPAPRHGATRSRREQNNSSLPLSDIFFLTLKRWPWIVLSLVLLVGGALFYILKTPTVYTRSAQIMIKDTTKGQSTGMDQFADMALLTENTDVNNEITNLRSPDLMSEVVERLGLDIDYYRKGRFHNTVAYGLQLPVKVSLVNFPNDASVRFHLEVSPGGEVNISHIHSGDKVVEGSFKTHLGDSVSTPVGIMAVIPTNAYDNRTAVALDVEKVPFSVALTQSMSELRVAQDADNKNVITLMYSDRSVDRADDILSTLIEVYKESWIRDKNEIAVSTSHFINDRLGVIESELGNVDSDISSYKSEHLIPNVDAAAGMYMSQNQELAAQINDINNQIQLVRFVRSNLTDAASRNQLLPVNSALVSDLATQIGEYNDKLMSRNNLVSKSSEANPLVQSMDNELAAMRNIMVSTVDNQLTALNTRLQSLQRSQTATMSKIATNPTQAKYLLSVERQQKVKEELYLYLLQKREENELSQAFSAYNTRVVRNPGPSGIPPTPAKAQILLIAGLVGLVLPFGFTFLAEMNNTRLRGRKDIQHLGIPFLGEIPQYSAPGAGKKGDKKNGATGKNDKDSGNMLLVKEGKRDVLNEAFRVLRTNVEFMGGKSNGCNIVAVTSFNPGSGKSFVSMNLAKTLALKQKRVLVIDGDMRHCSTSAYVGSPSEGLANYLADKTDDVMSLLVNEEGDPCLKVLPVGHIPPNPTELLESPRFPALLEKLRGRFDYIFIDCPPIEVVADAQIIDRHVDRTIFVIRAGLLERAMLPELERLYEDKKYSNMSLILNGTALSQSRYGYSHGYRYGYGYGYGNGYNYGRQPEGHR